MKKTLLSLVLAATVSGNLAGNAHAEEITVKKGDSLWSISKKYDLSVKEIMESNNLKTDLIHPKDKLVLSPEKTYKVNNGDTLWDIAREYGVSVDDIKKWNKIKVDLIKPGSKIIIKTVKKVDDTSVKKETKKKKAVKVTKNTSARKAAKKAPKKQTNDSKNSPEAMKEITVTATAYTASCKGCSGITATGVNLNKNPDAKVISVDPAVIPLGSKVYVEGYGYATAADTGGGIDGKEIDIYMKSKKSAINFGRKKVDVKIID